MKLLLSILFVTIIITAYFTFKGLTRFQQNKQNITTSIYTSSNLKTFESKALKFSIEAPAIYKVTEESGAIVIITTKGNINIDRNASNLNNLNDYVEDLRSKNKVSVISSKYLAINNNKALETTINSGNSKETKEYMIYVNNWVYLISTTNPTLYSDLDQIAQSFRYTGD